MASSFKLAKNTVSSLQYTDSKKKHADKTFKEGYRGNGCMIVVTTVYSHE